jgi:hypothetical protein
VALIGLFAIAVVSAVIRFEYTGWTAWACVAIVSVVLLVEHGGSRWRKWGGKSLFVSFYYELSKPWWTMSRGWQSGCAHG